ncbi:MAG: phosphate ABC transporter permease subunit PstC [Dehalococcoidia bacterium]|nr:phosphate ABC transporter permease subunit PstC [Dehalococcoidia bacterium]
MTVGTGSQPPIEQQLRKRWSKHPLERVIVLVLGLCALVSLLTTLGILYSLFNETVGFFRDVPVWDFLFATEWQALQDPKKFGIWELLAGTMNVVIWSMFFALPLGLAAAVYLSEYATPTIRKYLKPALEALAAVPTVVYAFFALMFISPEFLVSVFGRTSDNWYGVSMPFNALAASLALAALILPTIASVSEDAMANVPRELREGAYGLGATRLEVAFRVVFPAALPGVAAAVLLGIARVVGETIIVAVAAGSTPNLTLSPLESIQTMTGFMFQAALGDTARGTTDYTSLFAVGSALFIVTLALTMTSQYIVRRFREAYE